MNVSDLTRLRQFFQSEGRLTSAFQGAGFKATDVHGVYGGPWVWVERLSKSLMPSLLRTWESIDAATADAPVFKHLSNMFLVRATR